MFICLFKENRNLKEMKMNGQHTKIFLNGNFQVISVSINPIS